MNDTDPEGRPYYLWDFAKNFQVCCPKCERPALVTHSGNWREPPRLSCLECGLSKEGWPEPEKEEYRVHKQARCPGCNEWLGSSATHYRVASQELDLLCSCGAARTVKLGRSAIFGGPIDPYMRIPLWFAEPFREHTLWAYNREHLDFLHQYVAGKIRERMPNHNGSLVSRLPAWMKSAKNRAALVSLIDRMTTRE